MPNPDWFTREAVTGGMPTEPSPAPRDEARKQIHPRDPVVVEWAQQLAKMAEGPGTGWAIWADWLEAFLSAANPRTDWEEVRRRRERTEGLIRDMKDAQGRLERAVRALFARREL